MALSLRAEQKSITDLFTSGEDIYVIPVQGQGTGT